MNAITVNTNFTLSNPALLSDEQLLAKVAQGDRAAAGILFRRHASALRRYAITIAGEDAADDVVQEVFLALMARPGRFKPARGRAEQWLFGIARSVARNAAAQAHDAESLEELIERELEDDS